MRLALAILLLLPLYRFGPSSDLMLRASAPALAVLALAAAEVLAGGGARGWRAALAALLLVGAVGAAQEPERALMVPRWAPREVSLSELYAAEPGGLERPLPHYVARLRPSALAWLLREPARVPASPRRDPAAP